MDPIEPSVAAPPATAPLATDSVKPESPAAGGGATPFPQVLENARSAAMPGATTDSTPAGSVPADGLPVGAPTDAVASLAALLGQIPTVAGKDLPPAAAGRPAATDKEEADKPAVEPAVAGAVPVMAVFAPLTPVAPVSPPPVATATSGDAPAARNNAVVTEAVAPDAKRPAPSLLPQAVTTTSQGSGKDAHDASETNGASSLLSMIDRQIAAVTPLSPQPVVENSATERAASVSAKDDAAAPAITAVETIRQLAAAVPAEAARASTTASIPVPPDHPQWDQEFGERVVWLVNQHNTAAQLSLSPPDLGRLDVHINLDQDQARILFASPHDSVCGAIEAAVPRLRDMLAEAGIQLLDVGIERHTGGRQPHAFNAPPAEPPRNDRAAGATAAEMPPARPGVALGLVDYFI